MATILVVDDAEVDRRLINGLLGKHADWEILFAGNGNEALAMMGEKSPDLVVTDLQMPEMDGLELVAAARARYSDVPVVLMTAYGSEALAVEALERGAASYVPKSQLAGKLASTVDELLAMAKADRSYGRLIDCMARTEFTFLVDNDPDVIDAMVDLVQKMVGGVRFSDFSGRLQIGVALKAALTNALYHGNLELGAQQNPSLVQSRRQEAPYRDRIIHTDVRLTTDEIRFVVRDEGQGFDAASAMAKTHVGLQMPESGRGLTLMRTFMDEVAYNDAGNEVAMIKRRRGCD